MTGKNFKELALKLMSSNYVDTFVEYGIVKGEEQLSITQFFDDKYVKQSFVIDKQRKHVKYAMYNSKLIGVKRDEFDLDEFTFYLTDRSAYPDIDAFDDHDEYLYMGDNKFEYGFKFYVEQPANKMSDLIKELKEMLDDE